MNSLKHSLIIMILMLLATGTVQAQEGVSADSMNLVDELGRKQGTWREYFFDSKLREESHYAEGKKNGLQLVFYHYPNCLKEEATYVNDTLSGYRIEYYRNCKIKLVEFYQNGQKNGYSRKYERDGDLVFEEFFKDGRITVPPEDLVEKDYLPDPVRKSEKPKKTGGLDDFLDGKVVIEDSVIIKALDNISVTQKTVVVTDVTGSMYPYVGQLLLWYDQNLDHSPLETFLFFNDGDGRPDHIKRVGYVGGFHPIQTKEILPLKSTMEKAITSGSGGSIDENYIEALIAGIKRNPGVDKIILIADRRSPVSDMILLGKVDVPVHVVLCGRPEYTNPEFLQIAHATGGSVYSLDEDFKYIGDMKEGAIVRVSKLTFRYHRGRFVLVGGY